MLYLIRHASTGETRDAAFPAATGADPAHPGEALDEGGRRDAAVLRSHLPSLTAVWSSHAARAVETAQLAVREPDEQLPAVAEVDFGTWRGRTIREVHEADAHGLARWMADPDQAPPSGESFAAARSRARTVLRRAASIGGHVAVITHGGFIRAGLTDVLGAPAAAAPALGVGPASVTVLEAADDGEHWQIKVLGWSPALPGGSRGA